MHVKHERSQLAMLAFVFLFMAVTLYMALAGPSALFSMKQAETSEIKMAIVIARHGDEWPSSEAYFLGEPPAVDQAAPAGQLTNAGKERMYLLGKFLKLRYYERLLRGEPRRLHVRSADSDKCLESAQLLAAGLNPPRAQSVWSAPDTPQAQLASMWQPKAVHSSEQHTDELLSSRSGCLRNYEQLSSDALAWKNSTKYIQLLNEFRHDLQVLRQNTGLEFEDDLEVVWRIEGQLKARHAAGHAPTWYTQTMAQRLAHIADVTAGLKFGQASVQRLYAGRLLDEIARTVFGQVHAQKPSAFQLAMTEDEDELERLHAGLLRSRRAAEHRPAPGAERAPGPSVSLLVTDSEHLTALLNALQIYSSQPLFGSLLLVELHHDRASKAHFLRLYVVNSLSHNTFPEPVRVNPIACPIDAPECSPEQFEQNIRHLSVDKRSWWQQLCKNYLDLTSADLDLDESSFTPAVTTSGPSRPNQWTTSGAGRLPAVSSTPRSAGTETFEAGTSRKPSDSYQKLDDSLLVGPRNPLPQIQDTSFNATTIAASETQAPTDTESSRNHSLDSQMTTTRPTESAETFQTEGQGAHTSEGPSIVELTEVPRDSAYQFTHSPANTILDF